MAWRTSLAAAAGGRADDDEGCCCGCCCCWICLFWGVRWGVVVVGLSEVRVLLGVRVYVCDALHIGYAHTHTHTHTGMISRRSLAAAGPAACSPSGDGSPLAAAAPRDVDDTMAGWLGDVPVWYVK